MTVEQRRIALKSLLAGVLSPFVAGCAAPPSRPAEIAQGDFSKVIEYLQALITHQMQAQNLTGLSIAVVNDQRLTWTQGFGWADQAARIPASSQTVYRVGSITKLFTVAAALQFAERGQLDLDAPIQQALPEFRIGSRFAEASITPRQLMTHHAGLPRDLARGMWGNPDTGFQTVLDYLGDSELSYPPGQVWSYSNLGLSVLGAAVERLAKAPFAEHLQRALLQPLGMDTASISGPLPASPTLSKAYADGKEAAEPGLRDIAAGGLNASVRDMSRFLMMLFAQGRSGGQSVLRETTVAEMLRVQNETVSLDLDLKSGLGWSLAALAGPALDGGGPMASHGGATVHHRSLIVALPQHRLGVVILCNSAKAQTLDQLARTVLALLLEAKTGQRQPEDGTEPTWHEASLPEKKLQTYVGEYVTPAGLVRVNVDGQQLRAQMQGFRFDLIPDDDGYLHIRKNVLGLIPLPLGDLDQIIFHPESIGGRHVLVAQRGKARMLFGERVSTRMHPAWRDMLGIYLPDLATDEFPLIERIMLFEAEGSLNLRLSLRKPMADEPSGALLVQTLSDTQGIIVDKLADCGETISIRRHGSEKMLEISGYTFRKTTA